MKDIMIGIFLLFLTPLAFATEKCGKYRIRGSVGSVNHKFAVIINQFSPSSQKILFDPKEEMKLAPYFKTFISGELEIIKVNHQEYLAQSLSNLVNVTPNPLDKNDSYLSLVKEFPCQK